MGYDIIGYHRKTDDESIFHIGCMYAYEPIFKECFGKNITTFNGRVTKAKIIEFEKGVEEFIKNPNHHYNLDNRRFIGYLSNNTYANLCNDFQKLLHLMKCKEIGYLSIS